MSRYRSIAVVTGATSDIGRAIVRSLAESGRLVVLGFGSNLIAAEQLANSLHRDGFGSHPLHQVRVDDRSSVIGLSSVVRDHATEHGLPVDVLVNNAGVTTPVAHADLNGLDDETFDWIMRVNVRGSFAVIRALAPLMVCEKATRPAVIVNISSVAGTTGSGSNVAYCASKAALDSLTRSLGRALAPGIRVLSVSPGWVIGERSSSMPTSVLDTQVESTPLGRLAVAEDVASAVAASVDVLEFATGCVIPVDGGRPLGVA